MRGEQQRLNERIWFSWCGIIPRDAANENPVRKGKGAVARPSGRALPVRCVNKTQRTQRGPVKQRNENLCELCENLCALCVWSTAGKVRTSLTRRSRIASKLLPVEQPCPYKLWPCLLWW